MAAFGSKNDAVLIPLLASGSTTAAASERSGVSARTIHRKLAEPAFRARVSSFRAEALSRAAGRLADGTVESVDVLRVLLKSESENVRLAAARTILDASHRSQLGLEHEHRLLALEDYVRGRKHGRTPAQA